MIPPQEMKGLEYLNSLEKWKGEGEFTPETTKEVLSVLGSPQDGFKSIHIAGTNGKGSTSTFCASILGAAGFKAGLTTSPHFTTPTERIVIDGAQISEERLNNLLIKVKEASAKLNLTPTYHEALTVAAFLCFKEEKCDWGVIEVGLGGRLDSTNVLKSPQITAITSIGLDHEAILGSTLSKIAYEKCGIIKPKVPLVVGSVEIEAKNAILGLAKAQSAPTYYMEEDFSCSLHDNNFIFQDEETKLSLTPRYLYGDYQASNIGVATKISKLIGIDERAIQEGVLNAYITCRFEEVRFGDASFILDSAHNPQALHSLEVALSHRNQKINSAIFGVLHTKRWKEMCEIISRITKRVSVVIPESETAADENEIAKTLSGFGVSATCFGKNYKAAIESCSSSTNLVCGSMYYLGSIKAIMNINDKPLWIKR